MSKPVHETGTRPHFVAWYTDEHLHSGIGFVTPAQRHHGHDIAILEHRKATYAAAKMRRPDRWTGKTRRWDRPSVVRLNPQTPAPKNVNSPNPVTLQLC